MNIRIQDPIITHMMRTGYPFEYDEVPPRVCDSCGDIIDDYDLDAYIGFDECMCGKCWNHYYKEEE